MKPEVRRERRVGKMQTNGRNRYKHSENHDNHTDTGKRKICFEFSFSCPGKKNCCASILGLLFDVNLGSKSHTILRPPKIVQNRMHDESSHRMKLCTFTNLGFVMICS